MYQKDSWIVSAIWGRIGAAIIALVAFALGTVGYVVTPDDQEAAYTLVAGILAGIAGVLALVSKIRESKKVEE